MRLSRTFSNGHIEELHMTSSWDLLEVVEEMPPTLEEPYDRMMQQFQQLKRNDPSTVYVYFQRRALHTDHFTWLSWVSCPDCPKLLLLMPIPFEKLYCHVARSLPRKTTTSCMLLVMCHSARLGEKKGSGQGLRSCVTLPISLDSLHDRPSLRTMPPPVPRFGGHATATAASRRNQAA